MNRKIKKTVCFIAAAGMLAGLCGCGNKTETTSTEGAKLTYWVEFGNQPTSGVNNYAELPLYKAILEKTGIDVTFKHPVNGQVAEQFNLLLASGELPDIIAYQFATNYPGGATKAIKDQCIAVLDMEKAPNLSAFLKENPHIDKQVKTDDGDYYTFPCIYDGDGLLVYTGIIGRGDLFGKMNIALPETIDEWETALTKAKNEFGIKSPLTISYSDSRYFAQAFGTMQGTYVVDGKVKYGEYEDEFKSFVELMKKWYEAGLLDSKIASVDGKIKKQNIINGDTLAAVGNVGGGIGTWSKSLTGEGETLEPIQYPVINKGDVPFGGHWINEYSPFGSACITTQCKNLDAAYKLLDFGYGEEGHLMFNFGIEGESYEMIDGYPTYTELITNNPDGKAMGDILGIYTCPNGVSPTVKDERYMEQYSSLPSQKKALEMWAQTDAKTHLMPPVTLTPEESSEASKLGTDIQSYIEQSVLKFITGVDSMDKYEDFRAELKKLGIERYLEIYQGAYDRYQKR